MHRVGFSLVGGSHQFLHGLPVAALLAQRPDTKVTAFALSNSDAQAAERMLRELGGSSAQVVVLDLPVIDRLLETWSEPKPLKTLRLAWWGKRLIGLDCVVAMERTSAQLARWSPRGALVQIPHGVGGARCAGGSGVDKRFARFDLALVAGEADRRSTIALGLLPPERVIAVGHVKLAGLKRLGRLDRTPIFANERPTILYNPHFHPRRGTWARFGRHVIEAVRASGTFNLIVAPHVRLFEDAPEAELQALRAMSEPDWLIVDPGSAKSVDMTYTLGADIYLGDFSSQLYEWLIYPRPCVFIDQNGDGGAGDTKLPKMWSLGETVTSPEQLATALRRAIARHGGFRDRQEEATRDAIGDLKVPADEVAARSIADFLSWRKQQPSGW